VREDVLGSTDHALYMTAAMTGLRPGRARGAALARRGLDGGRGAGTAQLQLRAVGDAQVASLKPCRADGRPVAAELECHFQRSAYRADDHLVFCHPHTGNPYDASNLRDRFYEAMAAAGMGERCGRKGGITFHSLRHKFGTRMAAVGVPMRTL
jgi:integrase